ncbi:MAG: transglutaminase-like cysteine peptidase [Thiobacillaceae bacterium]|nr:transglutaminase-like cysteine peptidase [Thiobacillaceae bacterium]MDW8322731.1 transglutaminase-like cysteine peptidase [Burkholderiales bacterium]
MTELLPDEGVIARIAERHGTAAAQRLRQWRELVRTIHGLPEEQRVERVNRFFNRIPNRTDQEHWGRADYWATPLELLVTHGGDCEDFALAKYFTLRAAGVPDERLRVTYVRAWIASERRLESHMVLAYYPYADAEPLILDNLVYEIKPASERTDLTPTLGFNAAGLWAAKQRGQGQRVGEVDRIHHWIEFMQRWGEQQRTGAIR